jgi:hypothetical protein
MLAANPTEESLSMAETIRKKKTSATKLRKAATKKTASVQVAKPAMPSREAIEQLARSYWAERGYQDGFAEQDWLRAEQELLKMAS